MRYARAWLTCVISVLMIPWLSVNAEEPGAATIAMSSSASRRPSAVS